MIKHPTKTQQLKNAINQIKNDSTITQQQKTKLIDYIINNKIDLYKIYLDDLKTQLL